MIGPGMLQLVGQEFHRLNPGAMPYQKAGSRGANTTQSPDKTLHTYRSPLSHRAVGAEARLSIFAWMQHCCESLDAETCRRRKRVRCVDCLHGPGQAGSGAGTRSAHGSAHRLRSCGRGHGCPTPCTRTTTEPGSTATGTSKAPARSPIHGTSGRTYRRPAAQVSPGGAPRRAGTGEAGFARPFTGTCR